MSALQSSTQDSLLNDALFAHLKREVIEATGLAYYGDKDVVLAERIRRRMCTLGLTSGSAYAARLSDPAHREAELDLLIQELTIGETFFFRHREQFDALRDVVIPELLERNRDTKRLRVWSAGCSIGAEPYSVSILLRTVFGDRLEGWEINIVGTDINRGFLAQAREASFAEWAFRNCTGEFRDQYFESSGKGWTLRRRFRDGVSFEYHNLVQHPFPSLLHNLANFDIILFRNVLIYFDVDVSRTTISRFEKCLVGGGWLLPGYAELNPDLFTGFQPVNFPGATLYRKASAIQSSNTRVAWIQPDATPANNGSPTVSVGNTGPLGPHFPPLENWTPPVLPEIPNSFGEPRKPQRREGDSADADSAGSSSESKLESLRRLCDHGQLAEAAILCRRLIEEDGLNPAVHFYHSLILEPMGLHGEADSALRRAIYLDRRFALAHYYLGLLQQKSSDPKGAARSFRNALKILATMDQEQSLTAADGMKVKELTKLAEMQLATLETSSSNSGTFVVPPSGGTSVSNRGRTASSSQ